MDVVQAIYDGENLTKPQEPTKDIPETLKQLEKNIVDYPYIDPKLKAHEKEINSKMKELFDNSDFGMQVKSENLESIFEKGFLNTFETGTTASNILDSTKTSGPIEENHKRLVISHLMFGDAREDTLGTNQKGDLVYQGKQLERKDYEKYGYLLDKNKSVAWLHNNAEGYGDIQVRFKKDKVQCTWTFDDSLNSAQNSEYEQPSLTTNPQIASFDKCFEGSVEELLDSDWKNISKWKKQNGTLYIELQYHGRLTIDDVESITFKGKLEDKIGLDLAKKLKSKGIEIWGIDYSGRATKY